MAQEIIENNDSQNNQGNDGVVILEDSTPVSMKTMQSIYHSITGKTEKISKSLLRNHVITPADLQSLNMKVNQMYEQYSIIASNCSVTLYHVDDSKQSFSSFERFSAFDQSSMSPTENITLQYDFVICLPDTKEPQSYKIVINLHSRVAIISKKTSVDKLSRQLMRIMSATNGNYSIKFVDYTVARSFRTAIDEWYASVPEEKDSWVLNYLKRYSDHFPLLFRIITAIFSIYILINNHKNLLGENPNIETLFMTSTFAFGVVYIASFIAARLGSIASNSIDNYQGLSYLNLNRGDEKIKKNFLRNNRNTVLMSVWAFGCMITVNILVNIITKAMGF